jgi:hypothetical protein
VSAALDIVGIDALRPLLDRGRVIAAVRQALIWQSEGKVQSPLPGQLLFAEPHGDCHIKYGHVAGSPTFAIKVATGFYDNPRLGLPVNHGLILVFDALTGAPRVLIKDDGWLTAWRTAAATAIAAATLAPATIREVGVVGTDPAAGPASYGAAVRRRPPRSRPRSAAPAAGSVPSAASTSCCRPATSSSRRHRPRQRCSRPHGSGPGCTSSASAPTVPASRSFRPACSHALRTC